MAVANDALFNTRMAATSCYVSSNGYYGYVPLYQFDRGADCDSSDASTNNCDIFDSAMETDDDGYDYSAASCRLNNHYMIPDASSRIRQPDLDNDEDNNNNDNGNGQRYHCPRHAILAHEVSRRTNRKRCCVDIDLPRDVKKCRKGSGNNHVSYGTGNAKDYGLATVHHESASLQLGATSVKSLDCPSTMIESCCWAAGNHSLLSNPGYKHLLPCNGSKSNESSTEYEKMLFETHGCTVYHHYRQQQFDNNVDTEF